ncbi:MAG TPA: hypothetical protein PKA16_04140 [Ottowia sp.]|uniref:hypothetical protein n=1 Tax=Ottowia sp. TaxID=1898956 RepID=UPI002C4704A5|nr:hypothetical protein [Ottowia sp.]HMN20565.1 hypothetical protein [Ottowia sp.]
MPSLAHSWPPVRACLQEFTFSDIKEMVGLAGVDLAALAHLDQKSDKGATKGQLMTAVDGVVGRMDEGAKSRFVVLTIEEVLRRCPRLADRLAELLARLGWSYAEGTLAPLQVFDPGDIEEAPPVSHNDLRKAATRFRDGDLTGAISAACGAVDSATAAVYLEEGLGDPAQASFQERCKKASAARGVMPSLEAQLRDLGWPEEEIVPFRKNYEGAMNQGAYIMQTLRSKMGDVHGSKPILRPLVFEALKWAELYVSTLVAR